MNKIEKDVRFLKFYSAVVTLLLLVFLVSAFTLAGNQKFKEIDVERINVVEKNGELRMVISNSERQHPGISGGQIIKRSEPREPGIIFFCENGDECGGLAYSAKKTGDKVEAYGGLSASTEKRLRAIAAGVREGNLDVAGIAKTIRPGAQMLRQWKDQTHTVTALSDGFEWNGKTYKSLSAVAKEITGTNWNGYVFFGIKRPAPGNKNAAGPRAK